jgi:predicted 2-oxoglutarate/Fe(II)-dependent dioxygenase YbiX
MSLEHLGAGIIKMTNAITVDEHIFPAIESLREDALRSQYTYVHDENGNMLHATNVSGHRFFPEDLDTNCVRINNFEELEEDAHKAYFKNLEAEVYDALLKYVTQFPVILPCLWWKTKGHVLSYKPGSALGLHADNDINYQPHHEPDYQLGTKHVLAAIAYLNDDYEGGEIVFPYAEVSYSPKAGEVLLFPSNFLCAHEVKPITAGNRYAYLSYFGQGSSAPEYGVNIVDDDCNIHSGQVWMHDLFIDYAKYVKDNALSEELLLPIQRAFNSTGTRREINNE